MRISLPKGVIRKVQRAVVEFDLLAKGDKVLIGLSGGKDSTFLLYALSVLTKHLPFPVELAAMTIDLGFKEKNEMDFSPLEKVCDTLDIPYNVQRAELADDILNNPTQNPCARCSYFRRAIIHNYAKNNGYNKVAFAHHYDDAVETFLMSILYSGQVNTFVPKTYLDKTGVTVIRPLVYMMEKDIMGIANKLGIEAIPSPCPLDGYTKRAEAKQLIKDLRKKDRYVFEHLAAAMREGRRSQLWPPEFTKEEIRERTKKFWYGENQLNNS
ncbi:MAG: tRNA 2-thiocytidine biosynthesis TtcA family protein [Clostridia bacterium]|nr:tRNA 2-thiocytidine biosynthesis TtcA family protein [Clostridia bacterium]MDD4047481.1 tRNA 2-thiocytidine biosynthesis TtcA family protein [Clostridia bacterium]